MRDVPLAINISFAGEDEIVESFEKLSTKIREMCKEKTAVKILTEVGEFVRSLIEVSTSLVETTTNEEEEK